MCAAVRPGDKSVFLIILNWNGLQDTIECIESCRGLRYARATIVVVDNASSDDSEHVLRAKYPSLKIIQTGSNLGYAGGNNAGIAYALEQGADYVWLLNNDTTVDPMALTELVNAAEADRQIGMTGSKILCYADPSLIWFAGGWVNVDLGTTGHIGQGEIDNHQFDALAETGYITGCSLLVKRSVIEKVGVMDEAYFLYYEESDWCIKAKKEGYRLVYVPTSVIYHKESVSTNKIAGAWAYYMTRNRLYFMSRNGTNARWLSRFRIDIYSWLRLIYHGEFALAQSMTSAYWHWIKGYRGRRDRLSKALVSN